MLDYHLSFVAGAALAALIALPAPAQACYTPPCGVAAVPLAPPPAAAFVLAAPAVHAPIYLVNQGPLYRGPNIYAVPSYSPGPGLAPYPYVQSFPVAYGPPGGPSYRPMAAPRRYSRRPFSRARMMDLRGPQQP